MAEPTTQIRVDRSRTTDDDQTDLAVVAAEASEARNAWLGLAIAPVGIAALALLLFLYYRSLDLDPEVNFQQASALDWSTKLWPQTVELLTIAFWSTVVVVLIAIPMGIALTRPGMRRLSPSVLAVATTR